MNIYLDIDGVLITKAHQPALHVTEFLEFTTKRYPVYWLTTHCKGDSKPAIDLLRRVFDEPTLKLAKTIQPTNWKTSKTEAIDFDSPFLWFDDYIFEFERRDLIAHKAMANWVKVDLSADPGQLSTFIRTLSGIK